MKKLTTLYRKDPNDLGRVINELNPGNQWVIDGEGIPTQKFNGTACAIINGLFYKRYDAKQGKPVPEGAIPCEDAPDETTGHFPHWLHVDFDDPANKWHVEGYLANRKLLKSKQLEDGTYELVGKHIQGNKEQLSMQRFEISFMNGDFDEKFFGCSFDHVLLKHGLFVLDDCTDFSFDGLREYFLNDKLQIEGIVFHHKTDGRMCKIRKSDYGIKI